MFSLVPEILDGVPFEVRQGHLRRILKVWLISHTNMAAIYPTSNRLPSAVRTGGRRPLVTVRCMARFGLMFSFSVRSRRRLVLS